MKVLVIGAHADDPEVSMGGTISKLTKSGHEVELLICIIPQESRDGSIIKNAKQERLDYQKESAKRLNCKITLLDMDPYSFSFNRELVKKIDNVMVKSCPAARKNDISVLMYEQLTLGGITPTSFNGHVYIDISDSIEEKIESVKCYKFLKDSDMEAIIALARFRGNQIGVKYAECFQVCKIISNVSDKGLDIGKVFL